MIARLGLTALILMMCHTLTRAQQQGREEGDQIVRATALSDLGLSNGIDFSGLWGYRELYFPVPRKGLKSAVFRLKIRGGAAFTGHRYLQVLAGGRVVMTRPLAAEDAAQPILVPIDPQTAVDGFLRLSLRYSGALNADRCLDQRVAGDFLSILPDTALEMQLGPEAYADVRSVASLFPRDVSILLPDRPLAQSDVAAALRIASVLKRGGSRVSLAGRNVPPVIAGAWSHGLVMIGRRQDFAHLIVGDAASVDGVAAVRTRWGPALLIGGDNPAAAITLLSSRWRPLADNAALSVAMLGEDNTSQSLSFEDLGIVLQSAELVEQVQFDTAFSRDRLPPGYRVKALTLDLAIGASPSGANATIFAFMNGRLLGSRTSAGAVPATLSLSVPQDLLSRDNALSVRIQRPDRLGACNNPSPGQPVQMLPSSRLELAPASQGKDFFDLPQAFQGGVDILLPPDPAEMRAALTLLVATGVDLLPENAPFNVIFVNQATLSDRPFVLVSSAEPAGATPQVRFDQGSLTVTRSDGKLLLDLASAKNAPTIAQVLHTDKAIGLWLRPGKTMPESQAQPIRLDRGDVAVIDEAGVALAFSTERREIVNIVYHEIRSWTDLASQYRPWIVGALWLTLTLAFVAGMSHLHRRRRRP